MNRNEPFRKTISDFIYEKRAVGYKYDKNEQILKRIAKLHEKMGYTESMLPKELVVKWAEKTPYETETNRLHRVSTLRGLAEYMQRIGLPAYSIPRKSFPCREGTYVPYIYTDGELARIFRTTDNIIPTAETPFRQIQFSLLVRMLYGTGSGISELLNLEKQDFNIQQGTIKVKALERGLCPRTPVLAGRQAGVCLNKNLGFAGSTHRSCKRMLIASAVKAFCGINGSPSRQRTAGAQTQLLRKDNLEIYVSPFLTVCREYAGIQTDSPASLTEHIG
jgi:integrase